MEMEGKEERKKEMDRQTHRDREAEGGRMQGKFTEKTRMTTRVKRLLIRQPRISGEKKVDWGKRVRERERERERRVWWKRCLYET